MQTINVITILLLAISVDLCTPCGIPIGWALQGYIRRMEQAPIAFRGKVTNIDVYWQGVYDQILYKATFDVDCVYKNLAGTSLTKSVTLDGFGVMAFACTSNTVEEGGNYVILATEDLEYVNPVNEQTGVKAATANLIERVEKKYHCEPPTA